MIEIQLGPQILAVALIALFAQSAIMRILFMALITLTIGITVFFVRLMTELALQGAVRAL